MLQAHRSGQSARARASKAATSEAPILGRATAGCQRGGLGGLHPQRHRSAAGRLGSHRGLVSRARYSSAPHPASPVCPTAVPRRRPGPPRPTGRRQCRNPPLGVDDVEHPRPGRAPHPRWPARHQPRPAPGARRPDHRPGSLPEPQAGDRARRYALVMSATSRPAIADGASERLPGQYWGQAAVLVIRMIWNRCQLSYWGRRLPLVSGRKKQSAMPSR